MVTGTAAALRAAVGAVPDPEIPVLSIADLGVLRDVTVSDDGHVDVVITPTYSGCPAMDTIRADIEAVLARRGYADVTVRTVLAPAWTTDWMTEEGRRRLREFGIAPPGRRPERTGPVPVELGMRAAGTTAAVECPRCGSGDVRLLSRFSSTACKALYSCNACREPFDHFKAI